MKFSTVIATTAMIFGSAMADGYEYEAPVYKTTTTSCTKGSKPTYAAKPTTYAAPYAKPTYAAPYAAPEVTYTSHAYYTVGSHVYSSPVYSVSKCTKGTYGTPSAVYGTPAGYSTPSSAPYYAPPSNYSSPYGTPGGYEAPVYSTTPCTKSVYATPAPVYSAPVYSAPYVSTTVTTTCSTAAPYVAPSYSPAPAPVYTHPAPVYNSSTPTYAPAYTGSGSQTTISFGVAAIAAVAAIFIAA